MAYRRLLIIQLDSVPWRVLLPLLEDGSLPNLKRLYDGGCSGTLASTVPPITYAAWVTFMTGVSPGKHGILHYKGFDTERSGYRPSDIAHLHERTLYHMLSQAGFRVGVVMQPSTHPPIPVNGFLHTGFDSLGITPTLYHPPALEAEVRALCPEHDRDFNLHKLWVKEPDGHDDTIFAANLAEARAQVRRVTQLSVELARRHPVDVLVVYYSTPDVVLHKTWRWCLPEHAAEHPVRRKLVVEFWKELDAACGELLQALPAEERLDLVLSDHGHQLVSHSVFPNALLHEAGLLVYAGPGALLTDGWRRLSERFRGIKRRGLGRPIDWGRTRAFMACQACSGFVYVNLKGRQPYGSVSRADYPHVRDEAIAALQAARLPNGAPAFEAVLNGDEYFTGKDELQMPDIVLVQGPGVDIKRRARSGPAIVPRKILDYGIHHPDGLFLFHGAGVPGKSGADTDILHMAPTLLAAMGQPVPSFMDGRVLQECFAAPLPVARREWPWTVPVPSWKSGRAAAAGETPDLDDVD